jgi:hypothetical protein
LEKYEDAPSEPTGVVEFAVQRTKLGHVTVDVPFMRPGSFRFWLERNDGTTTVEEWIVVKPDIHIAGEQVKLE